MKEIVIKIVNFFKEFFSKKPTGVLGNSNLIKQPHHYTSSIKILIDNGHGKDTPGKRSPYSATKVEPELPYLEWEWNREIALAVFNKLYELGFDVELLVPEDEDIPLKTRAERVNTICNKLGKKNVLLISIHANACGNGTAWMNGMGWEAYTSVGVTESDKLADVFYEEAKIQFPDRKIRYDWSDGDADKEAGFYIIKKTACPAILTENFFYDNIDDITFILSEEGKARIIELHVNAIVKYLETK